MIGHCNHGFEPDTDDENLGRVGQDIRNTLVKRSGQLEVILETEELALRNVDETTDSWERFQTAEPETIKEKERKKNALLVRTGFVLIMGGIFITVFGGSVGIVIITSVLAHQMQTAGSPFWCTNKTFTNVSRFSTREDFALPASALGIGEPELHEKENGLNWVS